MKKLKIIKINNYEYLLEDADGNKYNYNLEFYDVKKEIKVNDYIYMADNLLDKNYNEYNDAYSFGVFNSKYGRNIDEVDNPDIVVLETDGERIYLERYFG